MAVIGLSQGFRFQWFRDGNSEIYGYIEYPHGGVLYGTSGYYKSSDPRKAAQVAQSILDIKLKKITSREMPGFFKDWLRTLTDEQASLLDKWLDDEPFVRNAVAKVFAEEHTPESLGWGEGNG